MHSLLVATRNSHKTREFSEILGKEFEVRDLAAEADVLVIEETGTTFAENAILKAVGISKHFPGLVVGDDSGLEVDALEGAPGIYSARYGGPNANDGKNITRLLSELRECERARPFTAGFRCLLALAREGKVRRQNRWDDRRSSARWWWVRLRSDLPAKWIHRDFWRTFFGSEEPNQSSGAGDPLAPSEAARSMRRHSGRPSSIISAVEEGPLVRGVELCRAHPGQPRFLPGNRSW